MKATELIRRLADEISRVGDQEVFINEQGRGRVHRVYGMTLLGQPTTNVIGIDVSGPVEVKEWTEVWDAIQ